MLSIALHSLCICIWLEWFIKMCLFELEKRILLDSMFQGLEFSLRRKRKENGCSNMIYSLLTLQSIEKIGSMLKLSFRRKSTLCGKIWNLFDDGNFCIHLIAECKSFAGDFLIYLWNLPPFWNLFCQTL